MPLDLPMPEGAIARRNAEAAMQNFKVSGMTCGHCVRAVTEAVKGVDPAASVQVYLAAGRVAVQGGTADADRIVQAIAAEGYTAEPMAA
jgi:copper chaperone